MDILEKFSNDESKEVAETCQLAIRRIKWLQDHPDLKKPLGEYLTVDPTPTTELNDVNKLKAILIDDNEDLFERYKAMFALRNIKTPESILTLCEGTHY